MLLVAGGINTYEKMQDALQYVDIIAMGRATLVDPQISYKLLNGLQDKIYLDWQDRDSTVPSQCLPEVDVGSALVVLPAVRLTPYFSVYFISDCR